MQVCGATMVKIVKVFLQELLLTGLAHDNVRVLS
jgi:hypothetical protein